MTRFPDDARVRIVVACLLVIAVSQLQHGGLAALALACAAGIALLLGPGAAPRQLWRRLWHVEAFLLLLLVTLPFTVPGRGVLQLGPRVASAEGFALAALIACKVLAAAIVIFVFLGDAEPQRIGAALLGLRVPERLVRLLLMTLRYLSLIRAEAARLLEAMRARSFRAGSNRHTWRSYGHLAGMLLVRALDRARRVDEAMRCRGFAGRMPYAPLPAIRRDGWTWMSLAASVAIALSLADRLWIRP